MERLVKFVSTGSLVVSGVGLAAYSCLFTVDGGEKAVLWDMSGVKDNVYGEGTHFFVPIKQKPYKFDVRIKPRSIKTTTGTKDLQTVSITLRVLYQPKFSKLPQIFKSLGMDYDERVLPSIGNETMKAIVASYNAEELITQRESVSVEIRKMIQQEGDKYNIQFVDISITDLQFGKEFTQAVEYKQVAEQETEKQRFVVQMAQFEKQAAIIRAQGESESARLVSDAIEKSGQGLIELRRIEAAREIANKMSNSRNVTYMPHNGNFLFNMPHFAGDPRQSSSPMKQ